MTHYIKSWLNGEVIPNVQTIAPKASNTLNQAIEEPSKLGWQQFFCGRISEESGTLYNYDIQNAS
jgi:hypothetical protein